MSVRFTVSLPKFLNCPICREYFNQCVTTPCKHKFCKSCIEKTLFCTVCKTKLCSINDCQEDSWLNQEIQNLTVLCSFKGCQWKGKFKELDYHLNEVCSFNKIECSNVDCNHVTKRHKMQDHETYCQHRFIDCPHCTFKIKYGQLQSHYSKDCLNYPISCEFCREKMFRKNLQNHLSNYCPSSEVLCPFGCKEKIKRKNITSHLTKNSTNHLIILFQKNIQLENELFKVKKEIEEIHCLESMDENRIILKQNSTEVQKYPFEVLWRINQKSIKKFEQLISPQFKLQPGKFYISCLFEDTSMRLDLHISEMKYVSILKFNFYNLEFLQSCEDLMEEFKFSENNSFHGVERKIVQEKLVDCIKEFTIKLVIHSIE
eukprot:gene4995-8593_t